MSAHLTFVVRRAGAILLPAVLAVACAGAPREPAPDATSQQTTESGSGPDAASPEPSDPASAAVTPTAPVPTPTAPLRSLALEQVAADLSQPIHAVALPGDDAVYVIERDGRVLRIEAGATTVFLDLRDAVHSAQSIEQGLLGIAFHPDFPADDRVFLFHSLPSNDNVLVSYHATAETADPASRTRLLTIDKAPDMQRHNGGMLAFGPDGMLYISVGDGAQASVNGQDPHTLLGTILRLDVDGAAPYAIPPDNPFANGVEGAPEVFLWGLRNPWRFAIDPETGLWIGDVGQDTVEEIDLVGFERGGANLGWPYREGTRTFRRGEPGGDVIDPIVEHRHADGACSITGGVVYRGSAIPELDGTYLYGDWCFGWIRSVVWDGGAVTAATDRSDDLPAENVSSFGVDGHGEILVVDYGAGTVSRVVAVR